MTNRRVRSSRAASASDATRRVTEVVDGLLVSKPAKPEIIDLQEYASLVRLLLLFKVSIN